MHTSLRSRPLFWNVELIALHHDEIVTNEKNSADSVGRRVHMIYRALGKIATWADVQTVSYPKLTPG